MRPSTPLQALPLQRFVIVLVDRVLGGVRSLGGHLTRNAAVAVPGDRAGSHLVGRPGRRALTRVIVGDPVARRGLFPVWTGTVMTGEGGVVAPRPEGVRRDSALGCCEQRLSTSIVVGVRSVLLDILGEYFGDRRAEADHPLAVVLLFQRGSRFGAVVEIEQLGIGIEVAEIERSEATHARADVPQHFEGGMVVLGSVGVRSAVVLQQRRGGLAVEFHITRLIPLVDVGDVDLLGEAFVDGLDPFEKLDVVFERLHFALERDRGEVLARSILFEGLKHPAVQLGDGVDIVVLAPLDPQLQSVVVGLLGLRGGFRRSGVEVSPPRFARAQVLRRDHRTRL